MLRRIAHRVRSRLVLLFCCGLLAATVPALPAAASAARLGEVPYSSAMLSSVMARIPTAALGDDHTAHAQPVVHRRPC